jgi:hydroxymethylbilane synthase
MGAIPEREIPTDVLISSSGLRFQELPQGARIGTSSLRRAAQLKHARPDIAIVPLRGNLDTRLRKLESENIEAIILAAAGVLRLNHEAKITEHLNEAMMLPAVGQGALCIEIRRDDPQTHDLVRALDHKPTKLTIQGERAFLGYLEGGCQVPIAGFGRITGDTYTLTGLVADVEGKNLIKDTLSGPVTSVEIIGRKLAERLLERGAAGILDRLKSEAP